MDTPLLMTFAAGRENDEAAPQGTDAGTSADATEAVASQSESVAARRFLLTSSAFRDGDRLPASYRCERNGQSPPLAWSPGPSATRSYALVFRDLSAHRYHWVIYDIPSEVRELEAGLPIAAQPAHPSGARQAANYRGESGYVGPCNLLGTNQFELTLYALEDERLVLHAESATAELVRERLEARHLASSRLTVTSRNSPP